MLVSFQDPFKLIQSRLQCSTVARPQARLPALLVLADLTISYTPAALWMTAIALHFPIFTQFAAHTHGTGWTGRLRAFALTWPAILAILVIAAPLIFVFVLCTIVALYIAIVQVCVVSRRRAHGCSA